MGAWKNLNDRQKHAAESLFDAFATVDILTGSERPTERRVGHADLYAYATRPERGMDETLRHALDTDPALRRDLDRMIDRQAIYHFPRVAAASSGAVKEREGEGFKIRFRESKAAEGQTYVIIEIEDPASAAPRSLFLCGTDKHYGKIELPDEQDGVIQLLLDNDSEALMALRDVKTEIFIR